jgi:hypothetical protein
MHFVKDEDLSDEQARAMLEAIWSVVVAFVDVGFGLHPLQQVPDKLLQSLTPDSRRVVSCKDQFESGAKKLPATRRKRRAVEPEDS